MTDEMFPEVRYQTPCNCGRMSTWSREKGWPREVQLISSGPEGIGGLHRWGKGEECWER